MRATRLRHDPVRRAFVVAHLNVQPSADQLQVPRVERHPHVEESFEPLTENPPEPPGDNTSAPAESSIFSGGAGGVPSQRRISAARAQQSGYINQRFLPDMRRRPAAP
jgi:hypothetical protein